MFYTVTFLLAVAFTVSDAQVGRQCILQENGTLEVTVSAEIPVTTTELFVTFLDGAGVDKEDECSSSMGQIVGSGEAGDPYLITIVVDTNTATVGSPDCGHSVVGSVYTWRFFTVTSIQFFGPDGFESVLTCDLDDLTPGGPSVGNTVNNTGDPNVVVLTETRYTVEFNLADTVFTPMSGDTLQIGDLVRLRTSVTSVIVGVYMYDTFACNTPFCDDVIIPLLDNNACQAGELTLLADPDGTGEVAGSFTNASEPNTAFTQAFSIFRFVGSTVVYISSRIAYCRDPFAALCRDPCNVLSAGRRKREADTEDEGDKATFFILVTGENVNLTVVSPDEETGGQDTSSTTKPGVENCMVKPGYIAVLATLGGALVATGALATGLGVKYSRM